MSRWVFAGWLVFGAVSAVGVLAGFVDGSVGWAQQVALMCMSVIWVGGAFLMRRTFSDLAEAKRLYEDAKGGRR